MTTVTVEKRELKPSTKEELERICARYPTRRAALLPAFRLVERDFGTVDLGALKLVADQLGLPPAYVLGVFTFYTHYRRPTDGKYVIEVCRTLPCALRGADAFAEAVSKELGIGFGETTKDGKFTLKNAECMAACDKAPVCQVNALYHENLTPSKLKEILGALP
jgi:NADH-quinone oxidoreductase subunit E